MRFLKNPWD